MAMKRECPLNERHHILIPDNIASALKCEIIHLLSNKLSPLKTEWQMTSAVGETKLSNGSAAGTHVVSQNALIHH